MASQPAAPRRPVRHAAIAVRCRVARRGRGWRASAFLHYAAAYITATRSQSWPTTPKSWVMKDDGQPPLCAAGSSSSARICACTVSVERGGRLVGDDPPRGRWRAPSRCRHAGASRPTSRAGSRSPAPAHWGSDGLQKLDGLAAPVLAPDGPMAGDCLDQLIPDAGRAGAASLRVLEDVRDLAAAQGAELTVGRARTRSAPW